MKDIRGTDYGGQMHGWRTIKSFGARASSLREKEVTEQVSGLYH
jgi:hypothetical protein